MKPEEVAEQVVYKFIKKIYNDELERLNKTCLSKNEIIILVNKTYCEKEKGIKIKIKKAVKQICTPEEIESGMKIDDLLIKMFSDPKYNKNKIIREIEMQQNLN